MFVSTNVVFLEDDYIINHKPKGMIVLEEVMGKPSDSPIVKNNTEQENTTPLPISASVPHRSGRIIKVPDRFMFLGVAYEAVIESSDSNPTDYEDTMVDSD